MSSPSGSSPLENSNYLDLLSHCLLASFNDYESKTNAEIRKKKYPLELQTLVSKIKECVYVLQKEIHAKNVQHLEDQTEGLVFRINEVACELFSEEMEPSVSCRQFHEATDKLKADLEDLLLILPHLSDLSQDSLEPHLDNDWGEKCLKLLISHRQKPAMEFLEKLFLQSHPVAFRCLVELARSKNSSERYSATQFFEALASNEKAIQPFCQILQQNPSIDFLKACLFVCEDDPQEMRSLMIALAQTISTNFKSLYCFYTVCLEDKKEDYDKIIKIFIQMAAQDNLPLQNCLLVLASEYPKSHYCYNLINENKVKFTSVFYPHQARVQEKFDRLLLFERVPFLDNPWGEYRVLLRLATKLLFLQRECHLISILIKEPSPFPFKERSPIEDCMPLTLSLLVGNNAGNVFFNSTITEALSDTGVQVCSFCKPSDPLINAQKIHPIYVQNAPTLWLQDSCFIHNTQGAMQIQVPHILINSNDINESSILNRRRERLGTCSLICKRTLGGRAGTGHQIDLIDCALILDSKLENTEISLIFDEGGNSLVGTIPSGHPLAGEPYLLIGRDSIDLNRRALTKELAALGLSYTNSHWVQRDPYDPQDNLISEKIVIQLIARDRGILPELVFPVEQGDYHLDTFMCVGPSVVVVNHSAEALEFQRRNLEKTPDVATKKRFRLCEKETLKRLKMETTSLRDLRPLRDYGIKVLHKAGRYKDLLSAEGAQRKDEANFFNHISLQTPSGKSLIMLPGCPPEYEQKAYEFVRKTLRLSNAEIVLLPLEDTRLLLAKEGSIRCMTKRCSTKIVEKK